MKNQNQNQISLSSSSHDSLTNSLSGLNKITNNFMKLPECLFDLRELNYFPFNSCNSPTIYSYKYWKSQNKLLIATKENNLKEISFKLSFNESSVIKDQKNYSSACSNITLNSDLCQSLNEKNFFLEPLFTIHKFVKIKNEALISSIDIFDLNEFSILTVCFALKKKPEQFFLQIYCDFETKNLDLILECCKEYELDCIPHRVTNLESFNSNQSKGEKFILVNCSNKRNILFEIDAKNRIFNKIEKTHKYFIEFNSEILDDNCTSHDIRYLVDSTKSSNKEYYNRRLSAIGCQNGWLGVFFIDINKNEIIKCWEYENDSFVTELKFFTIKSITDWKILDLENTPINLLVLRSLEPTRIFNNVLVNNGYEYHQDLEVTNDLVTSSVVFDATFSGYNSIVLGTFGKSLSFYHPFSKNQNVSLQSQKSVFVNTNQQLSDQVEETSEINSNIIFDYELKREIYMKHSILGLETSFLSFNGSKDLIVLTLNGISIWQYEPEKLIDIINMKVE